jgi:hypothetical protein
VIDSQLASTGDRVLATVMSQLSRGILALARPSVRRAVAYDGARHHDVRLRRGHNREQEAGPRHRNRRVTAPASPTRLQCLPKPVVGVVFAPDILRASCANCGGALNVP